MLPLRSIGVIRRFKLPLRSIGVIGRFMLPLRSIGVIGRFMLPLKSIGVIRRFKLLLRSIGVIGHAVLLNILKQCFFTRCNSCSRLAVKTNRAPAFANSYARYSPIPLEAPVIQTTFLERTPARKAQLIKCNSYS